MQIFPLVFSNPSIDCVECEVVLANRMKIQYEKLLVLW